MEFVPMPREEKDCAGDRGGVKEGSVLEAIDREGLRAVEVGGGRF